MPDKNIYIQELETIIFKMASKIHLVDSEKEVIYKILRGKS